MAFLGKSKSSNEHEPTSKFPQLGLFNWRYVIPHVGIFDRLVDANKLVKFVITGLWKKQLNF